MREEITLGYKETSGNDKEITFDLDNKTIELLGMLSKPSQLLLKGGKMGVKGSTTFFGLTIVFGIINSIAILYAAILPFISEKTTFYTPLAVLAAGILFMYLEVTKTYRYVFTGILKTIYIDCSGLMKKICYAITDKIADELDKRKGPDILPSKSVNLYGIIDGYLNKFPTIAKKGLWFILKRIPFVKYIDNDITPVLVRGSRKEASELLYTKTNNYIINDVFGKNTLGWLIWMIPLNVIVNIILLIVI